MLSSNQTDQLQANSKSPIDLHHTKPTFATQHCQEQLCKYQNKLYSILLATIQGHLTLLTIGNPHLYLRKKPPAGGRITMTTYLAEGLCFLGFQVVYFLLQGLDLKDGMFPGVFQFLKRFLDLFRLKLSGGKRCKNAIVCKTFEWVDASCLFSTSREVCSYLVMHGTALQKKNLGRGTKLGFP